PMRTDKPALLVKRDRQRAVPCANLQHRILPFISRSNKVKERFTVSLPLIVWFRCHIFDFKNTVSLVCYHTFALNSIIVQHIHCPSVKISVYHILLFVGQQQQRKKLLFVLLDFFDCHSNTLTKL